MNHAHSMRLDNYIIIYLITGTIVEEDTWSSILM